jgi:predicted lipase
MYSDSKIFGLVGKNVRERICVVAFRGTKTAKEWLKDFDFVSEPYRYVTGAGDVHKGFQSVYAAVQTSVGANLRAALPGCTRILVTGHSLGSALLVLSALDIATNLSGGIIPELWPFAGPRTGRENFAQYFDRLIPICYRMDNRWDIVPHLPLPPYQHVQIESQVPLDGGFTLDLKKAHDLKKSYIPGLQKLITP